MCVSIYILFVCVLSLSVSTGLYLVSLSSAPRYEETKIPIWVEVNDVALPVNSNIDRTTHRKSTVYPVFPTVLYSLPKISPFTKGRIKKYRMVYDLLSLETCWKYPQMFISSTSVKSICSVSCMSSDLPLFPHKMLGIYLQHYHSWISCNEVVCHVFFVKVFFKPLRIFPNHIKFMIASATGTTNTRRKPAVCICITCT